VPVIKNTQNILPKFEISLIIGNSKTNPLVKSLIETTGQLEPDEKYPGKGNYFIRELPNPSGKGKILWIGAPDEEGLKKGIYLLNFYVVKEPGFINKVIS